MLCRGWRLWLIRLLAENDESIVFEGRGWKTIELEIEGLSMSDIAGPIVNLWKSRDAPKSMIIKYPRNIIIETPRGFFYLSSPHCVARIQYYIFTFLEEGRKEFYVAPKGIDFRGCACNNVVSRRVINRSATVIYRPSRMRHQIIPIYDTRVARKGKYLLHT